jgi:hypothetical protein
MKAFFFLLGATALVAACDRRAGPADAAARAVTGVVEVRLGEIAQRFGIRVDRTPAGFLPALQPLTGGGSGSVGPIGARLAALPFVRENDASSLDQPIAVETPAGTVTARFTYRTLGPWKVLDHAVLSVGGGSDADLRIALLDPRIER